MVGEVEGFGVDVCSQIRAQAADNLRDEAYPFLLWGAGASVLALELLQRFRLLQVSRVKALGEPVVDLCQQLVGCLPLALLLPQATVSRVASRPGVADAAGYRAWRRRTPATLSMFGPFRCTKEPYQRVIWATKGGFLRHKRGRSVPKTRDEMVWSPHPACTRVWGRPRKGSSEDVTWFESLLSWQR